MLKFQIINREYTENNVDALFDLSEEQTTTILLNTAGTSNNSFKNKYALEIMVGRQINKLFGPSMSILTLVCEEMTTSFDSIDQNILDTLLLFPKINEDVSIFNTIIQENK